MVYNIQFVQTPIKKTSEAFVIKKLESLGQKYEWIIKGDVFFKEEKGTYGKGKICEIRLSVPGPRIFASSNEESFEVSIAETIRDLKKLLKRRKHDMKDFKTTDKT